MNDSMTLVDTADKWKNLRTTQFNEGTYLLHEVDDHEQRHSTRGDTERYQRDGVSIAGELVSIQDAKGEIFDRSHRD